MSFSQWGRWILKLFQVPAWAFYRMRNLTNVDPHKENDQLTHIEEALREKEESLRTVLNASPHSSFLEIGIGDTPNLDRLSLMSQASIRYTGCDFDYICENHKRVITTQMASPPDFRFLGNRVGSYAWQLFECLTRGESFDVIYLDGHHTFYVDLPAILIADLLLKPGGFLLLDDVKWTLAFLRANMRRRFSDWRFYHRMYSFNQYEPEQQQIQQIKWMAEELLLKRRGYQHDSRFSTTTWWALRKMNGQQGLGT